MCAASWSLRFLVLSNDALAKQAFAVNTTLVGQECT